MLLTIYDHLKDKDLNPYFIGQHSGECKERFCIVREGSQMASISSNKVGYRVIDVILFVPLNSYIQVDPYIKELRAAMKELSYLRKTGTETPAIVDDEKQAYTASIEYQLFKKLEG